MRLLGRSIAWYAVWCAWKRRGQPVPRREFNVFRYCDWAWYYDLYDPADLKWGPDVRPPEPHHITCGYPGPERLVWVRP